MIGFGYHVTGGHAKRVTVGEALTGEADLIWTHLSTTTEEAQVWLRDKAKLDHYVVDALTALETRPRCEAIGDGVFLNLRGRTDEAMDSSDILASVRIWALRGRIFTVSRKHLIALPEVISAMEARSLRDPGDFVAEFAAEITSDLDPEVAALGDELDDCEEQLGVERVFELRRAVSRVRIEAIGYRRFLTPQRAALEKMSALPGDWLADEDRLHLSAAADRAARMAEELESIRERAALVHETLTDLRAEQLDQRSLVISIVAMVFLPLTFLTGLLGMNVRGIPYAQAPYAFDWVVITCVVIAALISGFFIRRHWFQR